MESAHRYFRIGAPLILDWAHRLTGIRKLGLQRGEKIGKKLGEEQMGSLAECLVKAGRSGEISKAVSDENYRQKLYEEFHIISE